MSSVPGGFYIGANGEFHDANGEPITYPIVKIAVGEIDRVVFRDGTIYLPSNDVEPVSTRKPTEKPKPGRKKKV